jgi:hypothetical protein
MARRRTALTIVLTGCLAVDVRAVGFKNNYALPLAHQVEPAPAIASPVVGLDAAAAARPSGRNATV